MPTTELSHDEQRVPQMLIGLAWSQPIPEMPRVESSSLGRPRHQNGKLVVLKERGKYVNAEDVESDH